MPPPDAAAALLERLLTDDRFRAEFRDDPAAAARGMELGGLADELAAESERAFQTLEIRESRSSLAGLLLAAAAEGVGIAELVQTLRAAEGPDRWEAAGALSAVMPAVREAADAPVPGAAQGEALASCPVCLLKDPERVPAVTKCTVCGEAAPLGSLLCPTCRSEGRRPVAAPRLGASRAPAGGASALDLLLRQQGTEPGGGPGAGDRVEALADAAPAPPAAGTASVAPVDPSQMNNTNAGGKLHTSEFLMRDAEGAPGSGGNFHAAYDLFAEENAPIRSPVSGTVVEVRASRGTSGQVFGGTVKVQAPDGRVWVFRHVTPGAVAVGQQVAAGTEIAKVSPWTDGPEHTHIELWKTLSGGYNVANMEDPMPVLEALYSGRGVPPAAGAPPVAGVPAPGVPAGAPPPVAAPPATAADVVADPNVVAVPAVQAQLTADDLDPRVVPMLASVAGRYEIGITAVEQGDGVSRVVIASVNGKPVDPTNVDARDLAQELAALDPSGRPSEVGTPWRIKGDGFYTEPGLRNRIEVGFRAGDAPAPPAPPPAPAVAPAAPAPAPAVPPAAPAPAPAVAPAAPAPAVAPAPAAVPPPAPPGAPPDPGDPLPAAADAAAALTGDDAALAAQLDAWIARKNPGAPLEGYGAVFVREGRANGVDPRALVAIARAESSLGSDPGARSINNAFGWGPHKPFPSWEENIATVARGLRTGYIDDGLDTLPEIQARYAPVGTANDPTNLNSNWLRNVRILYGELGGDPDGSIALAPSGQAAAPVAPAVPAPAAPAPIAAPAAVPPPVPAAAPAPAPAAAGPPAPPSAGRASAVFGAVPADEQRMARPNTARDMPAVGRRPAPAAQPPAQPPAAAPGPPAGAAPPVDPAAPAQPVATALEAYPGDGAPKEQLARWMAARAQAAGLPPELPVMAALVESGLANLDHGHADSLGFFQMRTSVWDRGEYAGYPDQPELQMKWFIDQALAIRERRVASGMAGFGTDPAAYGEWIADVERPAEQYRGRYQLRLDEARRLLSGGAA
ncbi:peptidoglycan DD-metalloendopeptidase family protein [Miltoncostaea marina]|uniref:peptidoglycan DD-metalloendopeptidase family protein n=1 Tax=Miltoncostaea marina TaxID=2843215 RepID=UPI001C3E0484|nr:peptidoglycan DD-metalloendopeptidase family protein [Miltoncostaea marina]